MMAGMPKTQPFEQQAAEQARPLRVAYILLYFPLLTETFVADEIRAIRQGGTDVRIISLLKPGPELISPASRDLLLCTQYAPGLGVAGLWQAQLHFMRKSPRLYFGLLRTLLSQRTQGHVASLLLKRLVIFLKAVAVARELSTREVDLLHAHFAWLPGAAAWVCARLLGKPFTVTVHAYDLFSQKNDLLPLIAREAVHIVAISEFNRSHLLRSEPQAANRVALIHCGVDLQASKPALQEQLTRGGTSPIRILSVGRLVEKKGHSCLISACALLKEQGVDLSCDIIGAGPEEEVLRRQIASLRLDGEVRLLGARTHPDVLGTYQLYDVFVLPSLITTDGDRDGIPVVLMEAAAAGLPLVSTAVSGIPELVHDQETGALVPPGDVRALAEAIRLLASQPALRAQLGRNARRLAEAQFDIRGTSAQLSELFAGTCRVWRPAPER